MQSNQPIAEAATQPGITAQWAQFASGLEFEHLPGDVVQVVKGLILDTLGAALAASTLGDCCAGVAKMVRANPGAPESTLLGYGDRVSALWGAFGNGALAHALNFDALGRNGGHLGVAAVVAPLVMAERQAVLNGGAVSGTELIAAVTVAAEFTARLAAALDAVGVDANEKFLEGQLLGYLGAAAGAGRILRFTPERMRSVMGLALMQSAGTRQVSFEGGAAKAIYGGFANHGALLAVMLSEQGIDARCDALEGPAGIYGLFYGGRYSAAALRDGLGETFFACDTVFKPWATSGFLHPFIRASMQLRTQHRVACGDIARIRLHVGAHGRVWLEPADERRRPHNAATAANSIYFGVAKTLANGNVSLADFTPQGLAQPEALALAAVMDSFPDERTDDGAAVEVTLHDGRVFRADAGSDAPVLGFDQLVEKFRDCARHAAMPVRPGALDQVIAHIADLENIADVSLLPALLSGRAPP
ncbi:MAG: hypothetical protein EXR27_03700 [Betaproteobacteria bacterium]|nr:hypothetical protein [Betaproteobacteria bacterium]